MEIFCRYYTPTPLGLQLFEMLKESDLIKCINDYDDLDAMFEEIKSA